MPGFLSKMLLLWLKIRIEGHVIRERPRLNTRRTQRLSISGPVSRKLEKVAFNVEYADYVLKVSDTVRNVSNSAAT
jgi:hypothetical protein